jgi:hypothetical protein
MEKVYLVFSYFNEPTEGVADFHGVPHYFAALFRSDLDEYDPQHTILKLTDQEVELLRGMSAGGNVPKVGDARRKTLRDLLKSRLDELLEIGGSDIERSFPRFRSNTGGAYGEYEVEWRTS